MVLYAFPVNVDTFNEHKYSLSENKPLNETKSEYMYILLDFSLTVKAATLIFISGCGSAISSAKEGKSGLIYILVKSYTQTLLYILEGPKSVIVNDPRISQQIATINLSKVYLHVM